MKIYTFLFIILLVHTGIAFGQQSLDTALFRGDIKMDFKNVRIDTNKIYSHTEINAKFKNGIDDWQRFVDENLLIPTETVTEDRKFAAIMRAVVERDGSLSHITVIRSLNDTCAKIAIKLLQRSPKWQPGTINGVAVRSYHVIGVPLPEKYPAENDILLPIPNAIGTRWSNPAYSIKKNYPPDSNQIYISPEVMPKFRNGADDWEKYVSGHITIPDSFKTSGIACKVIVQFVVEKNGDVTFVKVLRTPNEECTKEATRLLKGSGKWHPAMDKGVVVRSYYTMAILFDMDKMNKSNE